MAMKDTSKAASSLQKVLTIPVRNLREQGQQNEGKTHLQELLGRQ
jgi:hypothetical protein